MWGNGGPERRNEVVPAFMTECLLGRLEEVAQSFEDLAPFNIWFRQSPTEMGWTKGDLLPKQPLWVEDREKDDNFDVYGKGPTWDPGLLEGKCSGHQTRTWLACREPGWGEGWGSAKGAWSWAHCPQELAGNVSVTCLSGALPHARRQALWWPRQHRTLESTPNI